MAWNIVSTWSKQVRFFHVFEVQRPAGLGTLEPLSYTDCLLTVALFGQEQKFSEFGF